MSSAAPLHSDHLNLLIFRYLQEVGFESAAVAFHHDWHRPPGCHDPETLPFAPYVHRNELVSVVQAGLFHDNLQARLRDGKRRFTWANIDPRNAFDSRDPALENGAHSRPPSSNNKRKGRPPLMRPPDGFPTPAPRRQRKSEGSDTHINGDRDAMDVDALSASADAEEDAEAASPTVHSENEPVDVPERYDSMDVATQTDTKTIPKTSTLHWKIDKPGASIVRSMWNPRPDSDRTNSLLTVGESLCRLYQIPDTLDNVSQISHIDEPSLPADATVTASAWRPDGLGATCAAVGLRQLPDGSQVESQLLLELHRDGGSVTFQLGPPLLDSSSVILSLDYSPSGEYLLVTRTDLKRGLVLIFNTTRPDSGSPKMPRGPTAWRIFDGELCDVTWTGHDTFIVCGANNLSALYQVDSSQQQEIGEVAIGAVAMRALISHNSNILDDTKSMEPLRDVTWSKVRFDNRHRLAVFVAAEKQKLVITSRLHDNEAGTEDDLQVDLRSPDLGALAFRPSDKAGDGSEAGDDDETPSLLATAFGNGECTIYSISKSEGGPQCQEVASMVIDNGGPALALAWSPNGEHLAVGNAEVVHIWAADMLRRRGWVGSTNDQPLVTWRPTWAREGPETPDAELLQPSGLSWSSDGESLGFSTDRQVAIVRFRPPLNGESQEETVNGRPSP